MAGMPGLDEQLAPKGRNAGPRETDAGSGIVRVMTLSMRLAAEPNRQAQRAVRLSMAVRDRRHAARTGRGLKAAALTSSSAEGMTETRLMSETRYSSRMVCTGISVRPSLARLRSSDRCRLRTASVLSE